MIAQTIPGRSWRFLVVGLPAVLAGAWTGEAQLFGPVGKAGAVGLGSGAALTAGPAWTKPGPTSASLVAVSTTVTIDVTGIPSVDSYGSPLNTVISTLLAPNAHVIGIGWDVTLEAYSPSWLSELAMSFEDSSGNFAVALAPGASDDFSGVGSYSSGGIVDLVGLGFDFNVGADGMLVSEFFEGFDDFGGAQDGEWVSGTITVEFVPEPGSYGIVALGLAAWAVAAHRRRRQS